MALPPPSNQAFLREVDEELRRDQLLGFWQRYGRVLVVAVVAALAILAGILYWQHRREAAENRSAEQLLDAYQSLAENDPGSAEKTLAPIVASGNPASRSLARFTQADILLKRGQAAPAARLFAAVAADGSVAQALRDLALIRQTAAEFDGLRPQVVVERLRPLAVAGNPWLGSAGELVAAAELRQGRADLAQAMFGQIARDSGVPNSIRQRAVQMAGATASGAGQPTQGKAIAR